MERTVDLMRHGDDCFLVNPSALFKTLNTLTPSSRIIFGIFLARCELHTNIARVTNSEIAEFYGVSMQTVSEALRDLKKVGLIKKVGNGAWLINRDLGIACTGKEADDYYDTGVFPSAPTD